MVGPTPTAVFKAKRTFKRRFTLKQHGCSQLKAGVCAVGFDTKTHVAHLSVAPQVTSSRLQHKAPQGEYQKLIKIISYGPRHTAFHV
jgi:hypothetical protein